MGLITALGTGSEAMWKGLCEGRSGVSTISRFDPTQFSTRIAAEVKNFDPLQWFEKKDVKKMDSFIHYAVAAADCAMRQAGLTITPEIAERTGVFIGSGIGGFTIIEREHQAFLEGGPRKISPSLFPRASSTLRPVRFLYASELEDPNLRHARPAHRALTRSAMLSRDFSRRCRRHDLRRFRSCRHADGRWWIRRYAGAFDPQ